MRKEITGLKGLRGVENALSEVELFKKAHKELRKKYYMPFLRFYKYIRKIVGKIEHQLSDYEKFLFISDAIQTFGALFIEAEKKGLELDPILIADLILTTQNNYTAIRDFLFNDKTEEEKFLIYERLTRLLKYYEGDSLSFRVNDWVDNNLVEKFKLKYSPPRHKRHIKQCEFAYISSIRIPERLYRALELLKEETQSVSSYVSNLLIKHKVHEIDPDEVLRFNEELQKRYPFVFENKTNRTFSVMYPAYIRWLIYSKKSQIKKLSNRKRSLIGLGGLLYFILLKKEYPSVLEKVNIF